MKITKQMLEKLLSGFAFPAKRTKWYRNLNNNDCMQIDIFSETQYKTLKQNSLFHSLLNCFWESGLSSFISYDEMRRHYKTIAGLIQYKYQSSLSQETKKILWEAIRILPLKQDQKQIVTRYLKGCVEQELSWAEVTKDKATETINILKQDMFDAGVNSPKFDEILRGIDDFVA